MNIFEHIIGFLAPHACLQCGAEDGLLCNNCIAALPAVTPRCFLCMAPSEAFRTCATCRTAVTPLSVWAATPYAGPAKQLVHTLKFERAAVAADAMARAIVQSFPSGQHWVVTHVPTVYARVRQRGYDQAQCIARQVARRTACPYASLLVRQGDQRQLGQSRVVRQQQMVTAFRVASPLHVAGRDILLIDDVLTTGATLHAAAKVLYAAGARRVTAAVFAAV